MKPEDFCFENEFFHNDYEITNSRMLENFVPFYNATPFSRLDDAGAVLVGKTNLDEFSMGSGAVDSIFGPTKNVWRSDVGHIAGGSSGGSAVAVATGSCFA